MIKHFKLLLLVQCVSTGAFAQLYWKQVDCGTEFTLALRSDSTLWAWGSNLNSQLGNTDSSYAQIPVQVGSGSDWVYISAGGFHSMAIKADGTLWGWGYNDYGQLGNGNTTEQTEPLQIGSDTDWKIVEAGQLHTSGIKQNGSLWSWGYNAWGQLGDSTTTTRNFPVQVGTSNDWVAVSCGGGHTLALQTNNSLWRWGANFTGQLGDSTMTESHFPKLLAGNWIQISAGYEFSMALQADSTLYTWGFNGNGQISQPTFYTRLGPGNVAGNTKWLSIAAGSSFAYAIRSDSALFGWGFNGNGQLGLGNTIQQDTLIQIGSDHNWYAIKGADGSASGGSVYGLHAFGLRGDGSTLCGAGANYIGQLGDNSLVENHMFNCFNLASTVSVQTLTLETGLNVYPNPTSGETYVEITPNENRDQTRLQIFDITGNLIRTSYLASSGLVDIKDLPDGIYLFVLDNGNSTDTRRVVLAR